MRVMQANQLRQIGGVIKSGRRGFTIMEVIVVVVILGVLAAVVAPRLISRVGESKAAVARTNAEAVAAAMKQYMLDCGAPESGASLDVLMEKPSNVEEGKWKGPYLDNRDALKDPWGREYLLVIPGEHNVDFDIVSYGADGNPGGEGEAADITHGKR